MLNNAYNEIYPQKIINTNKRVVENKNQNHITKFFNIIKKRLVQQFYNTILKTCYNHINRVPNFLIFIHKIKQESLLNPVFIF